MLKHAANGYVANKVLRSSLPKVKNDEQTSIAFKEGFNVSRPMMRIVGFFELIGSVLLNVSLVGKKSSRIGTVMINIVLGGATFKHIEAVHGVKGTKDSTQLSTINVLRILETLNKTKFSKEK